MGAKRKDLTGLKFGRWTVLEYVGNYKYFCKCDCGTERVVRANHLTSNESKSCGCLQLEVAHNYKHTNEAKRRIKEASTGRKHTEETKAKIGKANRDESITDEERLRGRSMPEDYIWKREVKKLANYTCDCCKKTKCKLHSHHLDNYKHHEELRYNVYNGVCLCSECHKAFHVFMGGYRVPCTKEDYLKFKKQRAQSED